MLYVSRTPAPPLDPFVESIWFCEIDPRPFALERVLPSGAAQLIVNLKEDQTRIYRTAPNGCAVSTCSGAVLSGAASKYAVIDTAEQECVAGVAFRPGGAIAFFPQPAHELTNADTPLEFLWGRSRALELRDALLEAGSPQHRLDVLERALLRAFNRREIHPAVGLALDFFAERPGIARVGAVADRTGLSARRFIDCFKSSVGLAPKQYCRILRFQQALAHAEHGRLVDWTRIALDCGYFDQAHFIHDFRAFSGITPTVYGAARTQFRNHVNFLQSDAAFHLA